MTVLLEYNNRLFNKDFHDAYIVIHVFYILPIMLALCLMLSLTHYAQNYAGIIRSLVEVPWIT